MYWKCACKLVWDRYVYSTSYHYLAKIAYCFSFILPTTVNYGLWYYHKSILCAILGWIGCFQGYNCNCCNRYTFILNDFPSIHQKSFQLGYQVIAETLTFLLSVWLFGLFWRWYPNWKVSNLWKPVAHCIILLISIHIIPL